MEEGISSGPAGVSCRSVLQQQTGPAGADSTLHRPAKLPDVPSEPDRPGADHLRRLGDSDNFTCTTVEQSGRGVSCCKLLLRNNSDIDEHSLGSAVHCTHNEPGALSSAMRRMCFLSR